MRKIIAVLILVMIAFTLCGCAEVCYSVIIDEYGARTVDYKVTFNSEDLDYQRQKEAVTSLFSYTAEKNLYAKLVSNEEEDSLTLRYYYPTQTEFEIANGITGDEIGESQEYNKLNFLYQEYIGTLSPASKETLINYAMVYLKAYDPLFPVAFCQALEEESKTAEMPDELKSIIKDIYSDKTLTAFNQYLRDDGYSEGLADISYSALERTGFDYSLVKIFFEYSHGYKSVYANDYDDCYTIDGQKFYVWKVDPLTDNNFTIYQKVPIVWVWEVLGIGLGVVAIAVVLVITAVIGERKKSKESK